MLAYRQDQFYCQYLSNPTGEHIPPGVTMWTRSEDGKNWRQPQVLFPIYFTAKEDASIQMKHMHQRMGFYTAPNGRFLTMAFYGANDGHGVGRVVRADHHPLARRARPCAETPPPTLRRKGDPRRVACRAAEVVSVGWTGGAAAAGDVGADGAEADLVVAVGVM